MADSAAKPIIFTARGFETDGRLHVLDKAVFHVHPVILKLNSAFFFKFLDSPDKENAAPASGGLKYEWITKVDEDGTWGLVVAVDGKIESQNIDKLKNEVDFQLGVFEQFLRALYHKTYEVADFHSLTLLVQFADYYHALPTISASIMGALNKLTRSEPNWYELAPTLIGHAYKLRHQDLFRDSVIYIAGLRGDYPSGWERVIGNLEPAIKTCIDAVSDKVDAMVGKAHTQIMNLARLDRTFSSGLNDIYQYHYLPVHYRTVHEFDWGEEGDRIQFILEDLLENNLCFDWNHEVPGKGIFDASFLCGWISEEDMPWNLEEEDW